MHFYLLSSEDFNYFSTVYYQRADRKKKHVCGCEGKFAGKGSHTLAFVGWVFLFSLFLCSKNFIVILSLSFFLGLLVTVTYMKRLAFRSTFLSSYKYFWYGLKCLITHWLPNVLYTMLCTGFFLSTKSKYNYILLFLQKFNILKLWIRFHLHSTLDLGQLSKW